MNAAVGAVELDGDEIDRERAARLGIFALGEFGVVDSAVGAECGGDDLIAFEEFGIARRSDNQLRFTTGSRKRDEVVPGVRDPGLSSEKCAGAARDDDRCTIRTPSGVNVFAGFGGELLGRTTLCGDFPECAA